MAVTGTETTSAPGVPYLPVACIVRGYIWCSDDCGLDECAAEWLTNGCRDKKVKSGDVPFPRQMKSGECYPISYSKVLRYANKIVFSPIAATSEDHEVAVGSGLQQFRADLQE